MGKWTLFFGGRCLQHRKTPGKKCYCGFHWSIVLLEKEKKKYTLHNRNFRMGSKLPNGHAILTTRQTTNKWQKQLHSMRSRFEDMWEMLEVFSYCLRWSQLLETSFRSYERSQKKILGKIWRTYFKVFACLRIDTSSFSRTLKSNHNICALFHFLSLCW